MTQTVNVVALALLLSAACSDGTPSSWDAPSGPRWSSTTCVRCIRNSELGSGELGSHSSRLRLFIRSPVPQVPIQG